MKINIQHTDMILKLSFFHSFASQKRVTLCNFPPGLTNPFPHVRILERERGGSDQAAPFVHPFPPLVCQNVSRVDFNPRPCYVAASQKSVRTHPLFPPPSA